MRSIQVLIVAGVLVSVVGCGPVTHGPLPEPLLAEQQKTVDESWERALTPVDRLSRQEMLDALVITDGYQTGVDRLMLRSEKEFSGGLVVMEIHLDRKLPVEDRFEVTVRDKSGKQILRHLVFSREEVDGTVRELRQSKYACKDVDVANLDDYERRKREEIQNRLAAVEKIFPKMDDLGRMVEDE